MGPFSTANLAVVAYALVKANGDTPEMNSGLKIGHPVAGSYTITLPGDLSVQGNLPLQQGQGNENSGLDWRRDLILVTPTRGVPLMVATNDLTAFIKTVQFTNQGPTAPVLTDTDFAILILRSTIPTPTDSNGNKDGPV